MNSGRYLILLILPFFAATLSVRAQLVYQKVYGGPGDDFLEDVKVTSDGGLVVAGHTTSYGGGNADFWAVKADAYGNITWNRVFGGPQRERAYGIIQSNDGGYLMTGGYLVTGSYDDQMVLKLTAAGAQQWVNYYSGAYDEEAFKSIELPGNAGYRIAGLSDTYSSGALTETSTLNISAAGAVFSSSYYGGTGFEFSRDIAATADGGYVLVGGTTSFGPTGENVYLVKYNIIGGVQWARAIGGTSDEHGWSVRQTSDGGYILCGFTTSFGSGGEDVFVIKADANGNVTWAKALGGAGHERGFAIRQTSDGGYVVVGKTNSFGHGNYDVYVTKLNSTGALVWSKCYGGNAEDAANSIAVITSGELLVAGYTRSFGSGGSDGYLLKMSATGVVGISCPEMSVPTAVVNVVATTASGGTVKNGSATTPYPGNLISPVLPSPCYCANLLNPYAITGVTQICGQVDSVQYTVPSVPGAQNYNWVVTNGNVLSGQGTNSAWIHFTGASATVIAQANFGCDIVPLDTVNVVIDIISVDIQGDTIVCEGDLTQLTANVTGGVMNFQYLWHNGATTSSINLNPLTSTQIWVRVTDNLGCQVTDTVQLQVFPYPVVNLGNDSIYCSFPNVNLDANNPGATYNWSTGANSQVINVNSSGIYWVDVSENNCVTRDSIQLAFGTSPTVTLNGNTVVCQGQNTTLTSNASGGNGALTYLWTGGQVTTQVTFAPASSGPYWVIVTDSTGCTDSDTLQLTVNPYPVVNLGNDTVYCDFPQVVLDAGNAGGGNYSWSTGANTQTINVVASGLYWVDVDNLNCVTRDSINLTFGTQPSLFVSGDDQICIGQSTQLTVTVNGGTLPYSYLWTGSETTTQVTISPVTSGPYGVLVTDSSGCTDSDSLYINVYSYPVVNLGNDTVICDVPPFVMNAGNPGATYTWNTGANTQVELAQQSGTYWVDVTQFGCPTRDSISINFENLPSVNLGPDMILCISANLVLDAGNPNSVYNWSTGESTSLIYVDQPGTYWVNVTRCNFTSTDTIHLTGGIQADRVFIPNAFTPNLDELNRNFQIYYDFMGMDVDTFQLIIFDRWGAKIKEFNNMNDVWDGFLPSGVEAPVGVYVYTMTLFDECLGEPVNRRGKISLIR